MTDQQLLDRYRRQRDPQVFAEIVARHGQLVYATARRRAPAEAEDIAQAVFLLLTQKAGAMGSEASLAGWLHQATRYCARNALKMRQRREYHEREAAAMQSEIRDAKGTELREILDDGLAGIGDSYRQVLLLRYLEGLSLDETAARLGISVPAVAKRAERGLAKLGKALKLHGHGVSAAALGVMMTEESWQHLPQGFLQKLAEVSTGQAGSTVTAMVAGARMSFKLAKIAASVKVAAMVAVLAGGVALTAPGVMRQTATVAIVNEADPEAPGQVRLVQARLWVEGETALALKAAGKPVQTKSQWFEAMLVPTDNLHRILGKAKRSDGKADLRGLFSAEKPHDRMGYRVSSVGMSLGKNPSSIFCVEGSASGTDQAVDCERRAGGLGLRVVVDKLEASYLGGGGQTKKPASLAFDGEVPGGETLVFLGGFEDAGVYCLDIWEAVRMTNAQGDAMRGVDSRQWFVRTPGEWRDFAARTLVWQRGGKSVEEGDRLTRRVGNALEVQLLGVSQPGKWPGCWWTPEGRAIWGVTGYPATAKPVAVVRIGSAPKGKEKYVPIWNLAYGTVTWPGGQDKVVELPDETGHLDIEVAGAQWRRLGIVDPQNPLTVGQTKVEIDNLEKHPSLCSFKLMSKQLPDEAVRTVALDADGREIGYASSDELIRMPGSHRSMDPQGNSQMYVSFFSLEREPAKFAIELSPYESVRFEGFALTPAVMPPSAVAASEVKQAEEADVARHLAEARQAWTAAKRRYESVVAEDVTPPGLFKQMLEAASAGRMEGVVACFTPPADEWQKRRIDTFAQIKVATIQCTDAAVTKFGLDQLVRDRVLLKIAGRCEQMAYDWQRSGDEATAEELTMQRINGHWRLEAATLRQPLATHRTKWAEGMQAIRAGMVDGQISTTKQLNDAIEQLPDP